MLITSSFSLEKYQLLNNQEKYDYLLNYARYNFLPRQELLELSNHSKYYTYCIVNTINNKIYIGKAKCSIHEYSYDYIGSGKYLHRAIKKYGSKFFIKTILSLHITEEESFDFEKQIISKDFVKYCINAKNLCYNLKEGGIGNWSVSTIRITNGDIDLFVTKEQFENEYENDNWVKGTHHIPYSRGTKWMNNGIKDKMIASDKFEEYLSTGWIFGRLQNSLLKTIWIYNGKLQRRITVSDLDFYIQNGWKKGMPPENKIGKHVKGRIWITKDKIDKMVFIDELETIYASLGWTKGRYSSRKNKTVVV